MNKWVKRLGIICLIPVLLVLLLSALLYVPAFQNFAVKKATDYASEASGMSIDIKRIRLSFPLDLSVRGVEVCTASGDTLLSLENLIVSVKPLPLLKKELLISGIELKDAVVDTKALIDGMTVKGYVKRLFFKSDKTDLNIERAVLNQVELSDADLELLLTEKKEPEDTTSTPFNWVIEIGKVLVSDVGLSFKMEGDSMQANTFLSKAVISDGLIDLGQEDYKIGRLSLGNATVAYDADRKIPETGLDPNHIALTDIGITIDSIRYKGKEFKTIVREFRMKERSGLEIVSLEGHIEADTTVINIPQLLLKTPYSEARVLATIPWDALGDAPENKLRALFTAHVGKNDMMLFTGMALSSEFASVFPKRDFELTAGVLGNTKELKLEQLKAELTGAFNLNMSGKLGNLTDSLRRSGEITFHATTDSLDFLLHLLEPAMRQRLNLPVGMGLTGSASLKNREYRTDMHFTEGNGKVALDGYYDLKANAYGAKLTVDSLEPIHFMPQDSLLWLTAKVEAEGKGTDIYSKRTKANISGAITDIRYGNRSVSNIELNGTFEEHLFNLDLTSFYPLAQMNLALSGSLKKEKMEGMLILDMTKLDLYGFHLAERPLTTSFQLFAEMQSDFKKDHLLDMTLGNWEMAIDSNAYSPKTLTLHARSNPDTTRVSFHVGDLGIMLTGTSDLFTIQDKLLKAQENILLQMERDSTVDVEILRPDLPEMLLTVRGRKDNPLYNVMQYLNVSFAGLDLTAATSPEEGMKLDAGIYTIIRDSMLIDTVRATVRQDTLGLLYTADIIKKKYLHQQAFKGGVRGKIRKRFGDAEFHYTDHTGKVGLDIGLHVEKLGEGIRMNLFPEKPTLFFQQFTLNENNYILMRDKSDIEADMKLTGKKNASLWLHSEYNEDVMAALHTELSQISLDEISKGFTFMPKLKGVLNFDLQYAPIDSTTYMMVADMNIDELFYEGGRVGELMLSGVYLPLNENDSQADMHMYRDREEIMNATALYHSGKKSRIEGEFNITDLPLVMLNPFIPNKMASLKGSLKGGVSITGTSEMPEFNGAIQADSASVYVTAVSSTYRLDDKPITLKGSRLSFNKFKLHTSGENPFVLDGHIDISDPAKMMADLTMKADNLELVNVKRNKESIVYGKMYVNLNSTLKGPVDGLKMRGDLRILGRTDVTYVMTESPLTVQNRLDGLVTFVSFADTLFTQKRRPLSALGGEGLDMLMTIRIDPAVRMNVDLTPDRSSYVKLEGGGDLAFQYTPLGDMLLNGRYTLTGGTVRYELPIVSAKNFTIRDGSYIEWGGNVMNPRLNLTATERVRTSVVSDGKSPPRSVNFDVGLKIQQRLEDMALDFTLDAPEDMVMQSELQTKNADERRKLAVGLLVTGMYVDGKSSGMDMGSALSSFLQNEISNIAGSALSTVDFSFGMESHDLDGSNRTDYSFRFAKRFYNDRIRIVIGGRLSDDKNAQAQGDGFIDNLSIEYRLDTGGSRYVKLFHNKNYESLLEGEIMETGAGIVLKRRMIKLSELFDFRKKKVVPVTEEEE